MGFSRKATMLSKEDYDDLKKPLTKEEEELYSRNFLSIDTRIHEEIVRDARLKKKCIDFPSRNKHYD